MRINQNKMPKFWKKNGLFLLFTEMAYFFNVNHFWCIWKQNSFVINNTNANYLSIEINKSKLAFTKEALNSKPPKATDFQI